MFRQQRKLALELVEQMVSGVWIILGDVAPQIDQVFVGLRCPLNDGHVASRLLWILGFKTTAGFRLEVHYSREPAYTAV
ncbi:hypothetical protein BN874_2420011 [Candidatus Contendobacter odensis Run_B_J11]|uniref:Uncharacterized protein n=1 Tax=Candidatus Contendobacter odensis Run_B_J11 TaxID=1400861 RepID=A0A7U7J4L0_9GAMM|nr:hypothetical protein BN874_2420011 [Candidatus Contendobacter odensis Run_B_J11]